MRVVRRIFVARNGQIASELSLAPGDGARQAEDLSSGRLDISRVTDSNMRVVVPCPSVMPGPQSKIIGIVNRAVCFDEQVIRERWKRDPRASIGARLF